MLEIRDEIDRGPGDASRGQNPTALHLAAIKELKPDPQ